MDVESVRPWLSEAARAREAEVLAAASDLDADGLDAELRRLIASNRALHDEHCLNLDPASNVMNPRAEAALASGLGTRPSLGDPGEKYETGREHIERIEVLAAGLVRDVFGAPFAEVRVPSGALANLAAFMATCRPGDAVIVPPPSIAGHVTHHGQGGAGRYGLEVHHAPVDPDRYTVDVERLADLADRVRPRLITIGGSMNLLPHPVAEVRRVADAVGASVLFDAAHACGMFAGGQWPSPLEEGADLMTMSTYKSLGGPPGGVVLTRDAALAETVDRIVFPALTANFDAGVTAALAITMLDWIEHGAGYAATMVATAQALAAALAGEGLEVFGTVEGPTRSHQLAVVGERWGGGDAAARRLREANLLATGIGIVGRDGASGEGLRLGTPEIVRWGMGPEHMPELAALLHGALTDDPVRIAPRTTAFRRRFRELHFVRR